MKCYQLLQSAKAFFPVELGKKKTRIKFQKRMKINTEEHHSTITTGIFTKKNLKNTIQISNF